MILEEEKKFFIQDMIEEVHLEAFPQAANQILSLLNDENVSIYNLSKIVSHDSYIAATLIRLANSPFYGVKNKVTDLMHAISIIGLDSVKRLVLTISARSMFKDYDFIDKFLWEHMISVAIVSQTISFKFNLFNENISYVAGLLHDIGKTVMHKSKKINYESIIEKLNSNDNLLSIGLEEEFFGFNHCDVAKELLNSWNFDNLVVEAIYSHHSKNFSDSDARKLSAVINFSDYAVNWLSIGRIKPYRAIPLQDLESFNILKIHIDDMDSFLQELLKRINFSKEMF
ncbi:putative signal transduction protein [Desulfurella amilsii]|uniref:Putative signal transduction protein n=1 Tax=Desulfurella amilsii TaxID=1562698 RepID=A0A1X4XZS3_9BACT|nr:HDOD domain-containing protein [Desulfurella amilsii]OSS43036.1 putative signal transduction protein [Desulfurella amilsii]